MMGYGMGLGGGGVAGFLWGIGGMLMMIGIVVLIVWVVTKVFDGRQVAVGTAPSAAAQPDALDILRIRFARGEITEAEFGQAKRILGIER